MSAADRHQIVVLTSAFRGYAVDPYTPFVPQPIQASLLMLSPLGGWLRSFGMWSPPFKTLPRFRPERTIPIERFAPRSTFLERDADPLARDARAKALSPAVPFTSFNDWDQLFARARPDLPLPPRYRIDPNSQLDLSQWAHIASQGRDHYVRIVYEGRLKELGHRASLIKVTERRFEPAPDTGAPVAYLRQYMYIVVREPEKDYRSEDLQHDGRGMPLRKVRLTTLVTPHIDYPYSPPSAITDRSFWVMVGGHDFLFHGIGEDVSGQPVDFAKALIFVPNSEANLAAVHADFNAVKSRERRAAAIPGQKVTFAAADNDNTRFVTLSLNFENEDATRDNFFKPRLFKADVRIPAVEQVSGSTTPTTIRFAAPYLTGGFGDAANQTGLFAEVVEQNSAGALAGAGLERRILGAASRRVRDAEFGHHQPDPTGRPAGRRHHESARQPVRPDASLQERPRHALRRLRSGRSAAAGVRGHARTQDAGPPRRDRDHHRARLDVGSRSAAAGEGDGHLHRAQ